MSGVEIKVLVATNPVDFRKQIDGLAALVQEALGESPYSGTITNAGTIPPQKFYSVGTL